MNNWRDCIVVQIDLIGIKNRALDGSSSASKLMRIFQEIVRQEVAAGLKSLEHAYVWNDSVLLLSYVDGRSHNYRNSLQAAAALKCKIDMICPNYAIAVKGQAFPSIARWNSQNFTAIAASSYAMANCFAIETAAKAKKLRKTWYIDARIAKHFLPAKSSEWIDLPLLPTGRYRRIFLHEGRAFDSQLTHVRPITHRN